MNKIITTFFSLFLLIGIAQGQNNGFETIKSLELTDQIYEHLEKYYVDDINIGALSKNAIDAMLKELDPYTVYYHEANIEDYRLMTTGQYGGIGALIRKVGDFVCISEPYEGNPAIKAGLLAGDKILEVDGKDMREKSSGDVSTALKGPKGTELEIKVDRNGETKIFKFERDEIKLPDVPYYGMIKDDVGYIKLNSFTRTASQEVIKSFMELKEQGMKELVLDLRGNGGGLLIEAVKIVNMFVRKNQTVVTTNGRVEDENRTYKTMGDALDLEIPLVVLVNGSSASASEIVSGSLQDLDRAVVIGTTSYGKGLVQRTYDLDYGSKVKLTIAKYYTPSGRCVQRLEYYDKAEGERPEEVPDSLIKIFHTANGREVIDGRGIEPDVKIELDDLSRLTATLFKENIFFNYATKYYFDNKEVASADKFRLSETEYKAFKDYVLAKDITYSTASEEKLMQMKETAEKEGFYEGLEAEYEALMSKVHPSTERDLDKFEKEIRTILENEIVSRYYFQTGRAKYNFQDDDYVNKAVEVLQNKSEYNTILGF
jgi:carboxyl-terminal processing protease